MISIEHNQAWYDKVKSELHTQNIKNIQYIFAEGDAYADSESVRSGEIDFALIDGVMRYECMKSTLRKIKPGGWTYLDNADKGYGNPDEDLVKARKLIEEVATEQGAECEHYVDFMPTYIAVTRGILVQIKTPVDVA